MLAGCSAACGPHARTGSRVARSAPIHKGDVWMEIAVIDASSEVPGRLQTWGARHAGALHVELAGRPPSWGAAAQRGAWTRRTPREVRGWSAGKVSQHVVVQLSSNSRSGRETFGMPDPARSARRVIPSWASGPMPHSVEYPIFLRVPPAPLLSLRAPRQGSHLADRPGSG